MSHVPIKYDKVIFIHKKDKDIIYFCHECKQDRLFRFLRMTVLYNNEYFVVLCAQCERKYWVQADAYLPTINDNDSMLVINNE